MAWWLSLWIATAAAGAARPNIVLILADDLGWGDLGCYGESSAIPTPHLDRLAAEGMLFRDAHSPSAVCTPTRYGLLTGRYAWRTRLRQGVLWGYSPPLIEANRATLASFLSDRGYATAFIGKWHLGLQFTTRGPATFGDATEPATDPVLIDWGAPLLAGPHTVGFRRVFGIPASLDMVPYVYLDQDRVEAGPTVRLAGDRHQRQGGGGFWRGGPGAAGFSVEECLPRLVEAATEFLRRQVPGSPFFLYLALTSPHDPWVPTSEFRGRSRCGPRGDFIVQTDDAVGRILRALEEGGASRDTWVMFTSDNGAHWLPGEVERTGHAANGPWRGMKSDVWEGGHRVPFIARWPGRIPAGSRSDVLIGLNDVFATVADVLGDRLPAGVAEDSASFRRALLGRRARPRPPLVLHSIRGTFALRDGPWKLIEGPDSGGWSDGKVETAGQLYDLATDPRERKNLWEAMPGKVRRMREALAELREVGASGVGRDVP